MEAIVGHFVGDILFQNRWLAGIKRKSIWGMFLHCLIVTFWIALFANWFDFRFILAFASHFLIDWFEIGKKVWPKFLDQGDPNNKDPAAMHLRYMDDQILHLVALTLISWIQ